MLEVKLPLTVCFRADFYLCARKHSKNCQRLGVSAYKGDIDQGTFKSHSRYFDGTSFLANEVVQSGERKRQGPSGKWKLHASTGNNKEIEDTDGGEKELSPAQKAIQDRIRKAKQYKSEPKATKASVSEPQRVDSKNQKNAEDQPDLEQAALDEYSKRLMDYGAQLASSQQQELSQALEDLKNRPQTTEDEKSLAQENKEKLQKARKLAAEKAEQVNATLFSQINRGTAVPELDTFSRAKVDNEETSQSEEALKQREAALSGNAEEAASYLKKVMSNTKSEDANLRPEQFTLKRDEEMKQKGVEFISNEKGYNPLLEKQSDSYKPRSTSWGMYPRPADISKAYGGGRTYKPGEALETNEQEQARRDKTAAALLDYRKRMGLFIDSESEQKWTTIYQSGALLMQEGQLASAMKVFEDVIQNVSSRTKLGGEAQLQRAICLDSLGKNDEAYKIYLQLERHPSPEVQKRTKRMLFGFRAAENLKANTMSYAIGAKGSKEWDKYFTKLAGEWDSGYVGPAEDSTWSTILAVSVILVPLIIVGILVLT